MNRRARKERPDPVPGTVTGTSVQVRDANRLSVYVDGSFSFGMPVDAAFELRIHTGQVLDQELLDRCLAADESFRARQRALGLLAHRPRTETEIRRRLRMADFGEPAIELAVERMRSLGYLNDADFARAFARERLLSGRHGPRRVMADLRKKGIAADLAEQVIQEARADQDEGAHALAAAEKRDRALPASLQPMKRRQRLYAHLARRGFSPEAIRDALARLKEPGEREAASELREAT
ncbi:MAG: RecX family transcriptional regulator [Rhodothermales bacterium]|nr:RecX family transcriptional regulator [Rhodothermales bacterium]MBO6779083.1 RecX family transcriptional regulator [Rhodothermales bacterium]